MTRPAVIDTLLGTVQLAGAPLATHCASAIEGVKAAPVIVTSAAHN
jgi:hypothetical protein